MSEQPVDKAAQAHSERALLEAHFDAAFYRAKNPDVARSGGDPLSHFIDFGWKEGRDPADWFSTRFYLKSNPDVAGSQVNPFLHYLLFGKEQGRKPVFDASLSDDTIAGAFDAAFYLAQNPDIEIAGIDPLKHFLDHGWQEGRDPNEWFSTRYYMKTHPDVVDLKVNPLLHYLKFGKAEARRTTPPSLGQSRQIFQEHAKATAPGPHFEPLDPDIGKGRTPQAKVLAYYLPQFHAIPENDTFWGEGFTEWRNVARGQPRFAGHMQPVVPRDLGHYCLDDPEVMRAQITMAAAAGVHGFCFYYYRFGDKRVLEKPIEHLMNDASLDFPFTLMWANENWTRTWDGEENQVLLRQDYDPAHDAGLVDDLARHFADPRYMCVGDRPLFFIYRAGHLPEPAAMIANWRALFKERHDMSPLIFMAQGMGDTDPTLFGLDGAIEFPPHKICQDQPQINATLDLLDPDFAGHVISYDEVISRALAEPAPDFALIKTTVPHWDNEARRPGAGLTMHGSTPAKFEDWMRATVAHAVANPVQSEAIVAVNAWNEWAEAAYLEPDVHFGGAYLNALSRAVYGVAAQDDSDPA